MKVDADDTIRAEFGQFELYKDYILFLKYKINAP